MMSDQGTGQAMDVIKRSKAHEGPRNHIIAYALSIVLTALAFLVIYYQHELETWFVYGFLIILAVVQAVVQGLFWMHLKDRGHLQQRIFMIGGCIIAFTALIMALYWVWW